MHFDIVDLQRNFEPKADIIRKINKDNPYQ